MQPSLQITALNLALNEIETIPFMWGIQWRHSEWGNKDVSERWQGGIQRDSLWVVLAVISQSGVYQVACVLHWSNSSDFDSSVRSKQLFKGADLLGCKEKEGSNRRRKEEKSWVTKSCHIPDKSFYLIGVIHHKENTLMRWALICKHSYMLISDTTQIRASSLKPEQ